jgi:uncharacterized membrane protein YdjX (TVP38/TMEM64 family)
VLGVLLFVALGAVSALFAFFSTSALIPVALGAWGPVWTALFVWLGWTLGGLASYAGGRWLGRPAIDRFDRSGSVSRWLGRIQPETPSLIVALLLLSLQSELAGAVLGMARYPFTRYLVVLAGVEAVLSALSVAAGMGLVERDTRLLVGASVVFIVLAVGALAIVHRRLPRAGIRPSRSV